MSSKTNTLSTPPSPPPTPPALGPGLISLLEYTEGWLVAGWTGAALSLLLSGVLFFCYVTPLVNAKRNDLFPNLITKKAHHYIAIVALPLVMQITAILSCCFITSHMVWETGRHAYEAFALSHFLGMVLELLGGRAAFLHTLAAKEGAHFLAPPLCCPPRWCPPPFSKVEPYRPKHLIFSEVLMKQFMTIVPLLSVIEVVLIVTDLHDIISSTHLAFDAIRSVSTSLAIYGLVAIYKVARHELGPFNMERKFLCIKVALFLSTVQIFIVNLIVVHDLLGTEDPLTVESLFSTWLSATMLAVECPVLLMMTMACFPRTECSSGAEDTPFEWEPNPNRKISNFGVEMKDMARTASEAVPPQLNPLVNTTAAAFGTTTPAVNPLVNGKHQSLNGDSTVGSLTSEGNLSPISNASMEPPTPLVLDNDGLPN